MKYLLATVFTISTICIFAIQSHAEFGDTEKRNVHVSLHGGWTKQHAAVSGVLPLGMINGYLGGEAILTRVDKEIDHDSRARLEGGIDTDLLGIRAYGRYGRTNAMGIDSLFHAGAYASIYLYSSDKFKVSTGLGTWAESTRLLEELRLPDYEAGIDFGPRAHLNVDIGNLSVLTEFLPFHDFDVYTVRVLPAYRLQIIGRIAYLITLEANYRSEAHAVDVDNWHGRFIHKLGWEF